jgi:LysM repeat protein
MKQILSHAMVTLVLSAIMSMHAAELPTALAGHEIPSQTAPWNKWILRTMDLIPLGGGYATNRAALDGLSKAIKIGNNGLTVDAQLARPSFCSGGTYVLFVQVLQRLSQEGLLKLSTEELQRLLVVKGQKDGQGVWGRWNANGPGIALLFHDYGLGSNFESFDDAQPGDFMKIFWTDEVGAKEFGHLVVYMGRHTDSKGITFIRFWSSNHPDGYGTKEVPMSKIHWAIFSRLLYLDKIKTLPDVGSLDTVSRDMQKRSFSHDEVRRMTGMTTQRHATVTERQEFSPPRADPLVRKDSVNPQNHVGTLDYDKNGKTSVKTAPPRTDLKENIYVVKQGDTLSGVASHFETTVKRLRELNALKDKDVIKIGTTLRIPTDTKNSKG